MVQNVRQNADESDYGTGKDGRFVGHHFSIWDEHRWSWRCLYFF